MLTGFANRGSGKPHASELAADASWDWGGPWRLWPLGREWQVVPRLELSAGEVVCGGDGGFIGVLGPTVWLGHKGFPLGLTGGARPTYLGVQELGDKDMGSDFQLTSHLGIEWQIHPRWRLGYRFQHMSNSGLGIPNPGMNLHMFDISFVF